MIDLESRRAVVGGSTNGIGRAIAELFAELGAETVLLGRDEAALSALAAELPASKGQSHRYICQDFSDPETLRTKVADHLTTHGPADILINNTGGPHGGPIADATPEEFLDAYNKHLVCNHLLVQTLAPGMKAKRYGRVVNIVSTSVRVPIPGLGVSNTTRGAVASWAKTLSVELARFGITVNNILPGFTDTARLGELGETWAKKRGCSLEDIRREWIASIPAARLGEPREIAQAAAFLSSPAAGYITGESLRVDGGKTPSI